MGPRISNPRASGAEAERQTWGGLATWRKSPSARPFSRRPETDSIFRRLLGEAAWRRLHPEVRRRFAVDADVPHHYTGFMSEIRMSLPGWIFAQVSRLIGTPLAPRSGRNVPVLARVHRDPKRGGTAWERFYCYPGRQPVRVSSTKVYDADAGLMEVVSGGLGMYLHLSERDGALVFESRGYFWQVFGRRLPLPGVLTPGQTWVSHAEAGGGTFRFTLAIKHAVFGETVFQTGLFREMAEA